jgi:hypothetical protein
MTCANELKQKAKDALDHYCKNSTLQNVSFLIINGNNTNCMFASYRFIESTMEIKELEIIMSQLAIKDPNFEISLCHELAHLENALQFKKRIFIDPTTFLQKICIEILADKKASIIYNQPKAMKNIKYYLRDEIRWGIKNFKKVDHREAILHLVTNLVRYIAVYFMRLIPLPSNSEKDPRSKTGFRQ